jgi:predicted DNA-binding protein
VKRTQIYLDEKQDRRLGERAAATGKTKSELIRAAIDAFLGGAVSEREELARFRAAIAATAGIAPGLPSGKEYVRQLREADRRREDDLERRRGGPPR